MITTHASTNLYESVIAAFGGPPEKAYEPHLASIQVGPEAPATKLDGRAAIARLATINSLDQMPSPSMVEARRALFLAAREEIALGPAVLTRLLRNDALIRAAALSDAALNNLRDMVAKQQRDLQKYMKILIPTVGRLNDLLADTEPSKDKGDAEACLAALDDLAAAAADGLFAQWQTAHLLWRLCCFARASGATALLDASRERAPRWSANAPGTHFSRWLNQAIAKEGPNPTSFGIRLATKTRNPIKK
jgi:hypothetical protein